MLALQTLVEYGAIHSIASAFVTARYRIELLIGAGNLKYLLLMMLVVAVLLLIRRRRGR